MLTCFGRIFHFKFEIKNLGSAGLGSTFIMETNKAIELLNAYQAEQEIPPNSKLFDAMQQLKTDPDLAKWYGEQQIIDAKMKAALSQLPEVDAVRENCLKQQSKRQPSKTKIILFRALATAAILILCASFSAMGYVSYYNGKTEHIIEFRDAMTYYARGGYFFLNFTEPHLDQIADWLSENKAPVFDDLSTALTNQTPLGCKTLKWQGQTVSMVCFHQQDGQIIHLFIVDKSLSNEHYFESFKKLKVVNGLESFGWFNDNKAYLLTTADPSASVASFYNMI